MRISPITSYSYINNRPSFGSLEKMPDGINLAPDAPVEKSYPRNFSYTSLMTVVTQPKRLSENSFATIAYKALKDIRKFQEESNVYLSEANRARKTFEENYAEEIRHHEEIMRKFGDKAPSEIIENGDTKYICHYKENGDVLKVNKATNGKLEKTIYYYESEGIEKTNSVEYREDGTVKEILIGARNRADKSRVADKIFEYDEEGKLFSAAMNYVRRADGTVEMTNYSKPNRKNPEYVDRYVGRRIESTDGTVTYEGAIYFSRKEFDEFYALRTFPKEDEHKIRYNI